MILSYTPTFGNVFQARGMSSTVSLGNLLWALELGGLGIESLWAPIKNKFEGEDAPSAHWGEGATKKAVESTIKYRSSFRLWNLLCKVYMDDKESARRVTRSAFTPTMAYDLLTHDRAYFDNKETTAAGKRRFANCMSIDEARCFCYILAKSGLGSWTNNYALALQIKNPGDKGALSLDSVARLMKIVQFASTWNLTMTVLSKQVVDFVQHGNRDANEKGYYASTGVLLQIVEAWDAAMASLDHAWTSGKDIYSVSQIKNAFAYARKVMYATSSLSSDDLRPNHPGVIALEKVRNGVASSRAAAAAATKESGDNMNEIAKILNSLLRVNVAGHPLLHDVGGEQYFVKKYPCERVTADSLSLVPVFDVPTDGVYAVDFGKDLSVSVVGEVPTVDAPTTTALRGLANEAVERLKKVLASLKITREKMGDLYAQMTKSSVTSVTTAIAAMDSDSLFDFVVDEVFAHAYDVEFDSTDADSSFVIDVQQANLSLRTKVAALVGRPGVASDLKTLAYVKLLLYPVSRAVKLGSIWMQPMTSSSAMKNGGVGADAPEKASQLFAHDQTWIDAQRTAKVFSDLVNNVVSYKLYAPIYLSSSTGETGSYETDAKYLPAEIFLPFRQYNIKQNRFILAVDPDMKSRVDFFSTAWTYLLDGFEEKVSAYSAVMAFARSYCSAARAAYRPTVEATLEAEGYHRRAGDGDVAAIEWEIAVTKSSLDLYKSVRDKLIPDLSACENKVMTYAHDLCVEMKRNFYEEIVTDYNYTV